MQRTLSIIKPDAVRRNLSGEILSHIQQNGLRVIAMKMLLLNKAQAEGFYAVHKGKPFFAELVEFMCSGPIICSVLEGENAIARYREIMGATNYKEAAQGTIREKYALSLTENSVHGSDASETAAFEISYFFNQLEIYNI